MDSSVDSLSKSYQNWLRLMTLIDHAGKKICYDILHIKERLPTDGKSLYNILENFIQYINPTRDQYFILCPQNQITDESRFDLTLYTRIIHGLYRYKYKEFLDDIRNLRNTEFHRGRTKISEIEFQNLWCRASTVFKKHNFDMVSVAGLRDCEFSRPQEYGKPLLNCIEGIIQGNVESFACFTYIFCTSGYHICSNLNGIYFYVRVKK